jgi:hypothetical protein
MRRDDEGELMEKAFLSFFQNGAHHSQFFANYRKIDDELFSNQLNTFTETINIDNNSSTQSNDKLIIYILIN